MVDDNQMINGLLGKGPFNKTYRRKWDDEGKDLPHFHMLTLAGKFGFKNVKGGFCYGFANAASHETLYSGIGDKKMNDDLEIIGRMGTTDEEIAWYNNFLKQEFEPGSREAQAKENLVYAIARLGQIVSTHHFHAYKDFALQKESTATASSSSSASPKHHEAHATSQEATQEVNIQAASGLYKPKDATGEIVNAHKTFGLYNTDTAWESLRELNALCQSLEGDARVSFIYNAEDHANSYTYDASEKTWVFGDAEQTPIKYFGDFNEMKPYVDYGLRFWEVPEKNRVTRVHINCHEKDSAMVSKKFQEWSDKQMQNLKGMIAKLMDQGNMSAADYAQYAKKMKTKLIYWATATGDPDLPRDFQTILN